MVQIDHVRFINFFADDVDLVVLCDSFLLYGASVCSMANAEHAVIKTLTMPMQITDTIRWGAWFGATTTIWPLSAVRLSLFWYSVF